MSRFDNLPEQRYLVQYFSTNRFTAWQRRYKIGKGMWLPLGHFKAKSGYRACRMARNKHRQVTFGRKLRAILLTSS